MKGYRGAPDDLRCPANVTEWLRETKSVPIDAHGFLESQLLVDKWNDALRDHGLVHHTVAPWPGADGELRITRGDLFDRAALLAMHPDDTDYCFDLLWNTLAWGSGRDGRFIEKRILPFSDAASRKQNVSLLCEAAKHARDGARGAAYRTLIRKGGGRIPNLGPAFFTKFLYFASMPLGGESTQPCLILDSRVATALHNAGWAKMRRGWSNWYTEQYVSYCELTDRWAEELSQTLGVAVRQDEVELALFSATLGIRQ